MSDRLGDMENTEPSPCLAFVGVSDPRDDVTRALASAREASVGQYVLLHGENPAVLRLGLRSGIGTVPACKVERVTTSEGDGAPPGLRCWKVSRLPALPAPS
jgi:hypothetical protein